MHLILATSAGCAAPPAASTDGSVEVSLAAADAAGTPQRLRGELIFSGVDNGFVRSARTPPPEASEVLSVHLPAGDYALMLSAESVVESPVACAPGATASVQAWLHPDKPPLVRVTGGQVTRVRLVRVSAEPPRARAGLEPEGASARPMPTPGHGFGCSRTRASAGAESALTRS